MDILLYIKKKKQLIHSEQWKHLETVLLLLFGTYSHIENTKMLNKSIEILI